MGFVVVDSSRTRDQTHTLHMAGGFLTTGPPGKSCPLPLFVWPKELTKDSCFPTQANTTILNGWPQQKEHLNNVPGLHLVCVGNSQGLSPEAATSTTQAWGKGCPFFAVTHLVGGGENPKSFTLLGPLSLLLPPHRVGERSVLSLVALQE